MDELDVMEVQQLFLDKIYELNRDCAPDETKKYYAWLMNKSLDILQEWVDNQ